MSDNTYLLDILNNPAAARAPQGDLRTATTAIVGGGISGIILSLRLSREALRSGQSILLIEAQESLGGRLFFPTGKNQTGDADENFAQRILLRRQGEGLSGFGLECFDPNSCQALERHLRSHLSTDEQDFLDAFCNHDSAEVQRSSWIIKKDATSWNDLLSGPTEVFTRKEAQAFKELLTLQPSSDEDARKPFSQHPCLQEKSTAQAIISLVETIAGRDLEGLPWMRILLRLRSLVALAESPLTPPFSRSSALELACEAILRSRGVHIALNTPVVRLESIVGEGHSLKTHTQTLAFRQVVLAQPLLRALPLMTRDHLTGAQAKWVGKYQPQSLVIMEYPNFAEHRAEWLPTQIANGAHLILPVERTRGMVTSDGRLMLFCWLPYEDSLQAPSVREAVARIRRSAKRLLREQALAGLSGRGLPQAGNEQAQERIVLMPVANHLPPASAELTAVQLAQKGAWTCGDHFTFHPEPWANVVASTQAVAQGL